MATIAKAHCSLQSGVYFECSEQIMQKLYLTLFIFSWVETLFVFSCFGHCPDLKMTGETPEVRSDKMKQREKRGERDKREKRERKGEKKMWMTFYMFRYIYVYCKLPSQCSVIPRVSTRHCAIILFCLVFPFWAHAEAIVEKWQGNDSPICSKPCAPRSSHSNTKS